MAVPARHLICEACWVTHGRPRVIVGVGPLHVGCCWCGRYTYVWETGFGPGFICQDVHLEDVR